MVDLVAQVSCIPKSDGGREVLIAISSEVNGFAFHLRLNGASAIGLAVALDKAGVEADRVIVTPTGVIPS